jgi:hypothetical protein
MSRLGSEYKIRWKSVTIRNILGDLDTGGRTLNILKKEMFLKQTETFELIFSEI